MDSAKILTSRDRKIDVAFVQELNREMTHQLGKAVFGNDDVIKLTLFCMMTNRNLSLKSVPGLGKTQLALATGEIVVGARARVKQFEAGLMPADIIGFEIQNRVTGEMMIRPGPFLDEIIEREGGRLESAVNIFCADELNRANPKTQSGLLSGMQERWVKIGLKTIYMPKFFFMIATRNPIENEGTYPLPEAQLDRFHAEAVLDYLNFEDEVRLAMEPELRLPDAHKLAKPATDIDTIIAVQQFLHRDIYIDPALGRYAVALVRATRPGSEQFAEMVKSTGGAVLETAVEYGNSPRAYLSSFLSLGQAVAAADGRDYVLPSDIKWLAPYVMTHRLVLKPMANDKDAVNVVKHVLATTPVNDDPKLYKRR